MITYRHWLWMALTFLILSGFFQVLITGAPISLFFAGVVYRNRWLVKRKAHAH